LPLHSIVESQHVAMNLGGRKCSQAPV